MWEYAYRLLDSHEHFSKPSTITCAPSNLYPVSNPQTLAQVLASLPEEERFILTLHYLRSKSSAEIAELLAVPEKSVIAVIESGKKRLTAFLGI